MGTRFFCPQRLGCTAARPLTDKNIANSSFFEENPRTLTFFPPRTAPLT
jgi:hypothetical protein